MPIFGTQYGGWFIPDDFHLDSSSYVVSAGVGEDISFDLCLQSKYGCEILLLDPTERAITHVKEVNSFYETKTPFSGLIQPDYLKVLSDLHPDLSRVTLKPIGLWKTKEIARFYYQTNPYYVSQTLLADMYSSSYNEVPVDRLSCLIDQTPDVLKLDIEGAEIDVLETLFEDSIFPRLLCIEFDYILKGKDTENRTDRMIERLLEKGYTIVYDKDYNLVFQLNLEAI